MRKKLFTALAITAFVSAAHAQGTLEVYIGDPEAVTSFLFDDVASVKFSDEQMFVNMRSTEASPFEVATADVRRVKFRATPSGVKGVETDDVDAQEYYYNLQGIPVANPVKGNIYIRVKGRSASKVVF